MKTEEMIAKENVEINKYDKKRWGELSPHLRERCLTHLASCKRFLEEDKEKLIFINALENRMKERHITLFGFVARRKAKILKKIKIKEKAIQTYEDGGVR